MKVPGTFPSRFIGAVIIFLFLISPKSLCSEDLIRITDIVVRPQSNEVELTVEDSIDYAYFPLSEPHRIVFDFTGAIMVVNDGATLSEEVEGASFRQLRMSQFILDPPITRLVFYLNEPSTHTVKFDPNNNSVIIRFKAEAESDFDAFTPGSGSAGLLSNSGSSESNETECMSNSDGGIKDSITPESSFEIVAAGSETTIRFPDLAADEVTFKQLRFPDRLHVRMFTSGIIENRCPRFDQFERGNIWNDVAKQWVSYVDRDGGGVVDLTIYLYPDVGYTQKITSSGVLEIRLSNLMKESSIADTAFTNQQEAEIEVRSYHEGTPEEIEPQITIEHDSNLGIDISNEITITSELPASQVGDIEIAPCSDIQTREPIAPESFYELVSTESEVTVRCPDLSADEVSVSRLRFPERLHIRMFTSGIIDNPNPRFEPSCRGNIWNEIAKRWTTYTDREGKGVVDLTIYLYPDIGYTQSITSSGVPEIELFLLPGNPAIGELIQEDEQTSEVEVAAYPEETESRVTVEYVAFEETTPIDEDSDEVEDEVEGEDEGITEVVEREIFPIEEETAPDESITNISAIESVEVIENGSLIVDRTMIEDEETASGEMVTQTASISSGGISALPGILGQNNLLAAETKDQEPLFMRVGDVVILEVHNLVRASIGNPNIATLNVISVDEILITALAPGNTTIITWENGRGHFAREIAVLDATSAREEEITAVIDNDDISVRIMMSGDSDSAPGVVLEGSVDTEEEKIRAQRIAVLYTSCEERVTNLIEITDPRQVLVEIRVVEIDKRVMDEHLSHFSAAARGDNDEFTVGIITDLLDPENPGGGLFDSRVRPGIINGNVEDVVYDPIDLVLNELEVSRQANILSRPNMVALSGHQAHFRVGGEIPYTYLNESGVMVVEFKEFGISLDMRPDVDSQGNILLTVAPTVRTVDMALAIAGIPGFRTREMITDVQLRSGETLVIGGLIQNEITEIISEIPFLCDIPVLGQLFRSKRFTEDETELVIFLTPHILDNVGMSERFLGNTGDRPVH